MAEFGKMELRKARDSRGMPRWKLGQEIGVSESTVERWEDPNDTAMPTPDDVDRIADVLHYPLMWHQWMLSNCESYRKRYINIECYDLPIAVMRSKHEIQDVLALQDKVERDVMNGQFDDPILRKLYLKEVDEAIASLQQVREQIKI